VAVASLPAALSGDQWIALAGVAAGAVGALAGLVFSYFNARSERISAQSLARSERLHAQRVDAYATLASFLERQRIYAARTEPIFTVGSPPPLPKPTSDEEWLEMRGRASVAGTDAVDAAVKEAQKRFNEFSANVMVYRQMHERAEGKEGIKLRTQLDESRQSAYEAIDEAQRAMRDELAAL
jgi:hypothetical protein